MRVSRGVEGDEKRMRSAMSRPVKACFLLTFGLVASGVSADNAANSRDWIDLSTNDGAGLYSEKCGMCHYENGMATFILQRRLPAERVFLDARDDLQPVFVRNAVRNGMGLMFPMSRGEVSDEQLDQIVQYLQGEE